MIQEYSQVPVPLMEIIKLSRDEIRFLQTEHPRLIYDIGKNVISGILSFNLKFEGQKDIITDEYQIEIDLNKVSLGVPVIRETVDRIINIARQKGIPSINLHLNNTNGEMCIIIPPKAKEKYTDGFDLRKLIEHVQEHLYWISYFEKHNKAPWKAYGHGEEGYLELYLENKEKYLETFKQYFSCHSRPEFRRKLKELKKKYNKI
jgi:hypothetical protein